MTVQPRRAACAKAGLTAAMTSVINRQKLTAESLSLAVCRLDVELGRLEFEVHPYMALEQQLVSGWACDLSQHSMP